LKLSFEGRVALVTGGGRGIGQATALALAEAGADVAVNYRSDEAAALDTVDRIRALGRRSRAYRAAVDSLEESSELVESVARHFGGFDVLINNAGLPSRGLSVADTSLEEFERVMRVNAFAPFQLIKLSLPHLRRRARSDIVIVSSVATANLRPSTAPYAMAKTAAEALAVVVAREEARHGVRCNIVAPGLTDTRMGQRSAQALFGKGDIRELDDSQPFGHVCRPEEVASAILYLASGLNGYASGQRIYVNGAA